MTTTHSNRSFTTPVFLVLGVAALAACSALETDEFEAEALEAEIADEALELVAEPERDHDAKVESVGGLMADPDAAGSWDDECDGCSWILTTPILTGTGSTCGQAIASLHGQQNVEMNMTCPETPLCGTPARTTTVACHSSGGQKSVSGYAAFRCEWGIEEDVGCY